MYEKLLERIGRLVVRRQLWIAVVVGWIALALFMALQAPSLTKVGIMDEGMFLPSDSSYLRAKEMLQEKFPDQVSAGQGIIVFYDPNGLSEDDLTYAKELTQWLTSPDAPDNINKVTSIFDQPTLKDVLLSEDGQAMLMPVTFTTADYDPQTNEAVEAIRAHIQATAPGSLIIHLTGPAAIGRDMFKVILESVDKTTLATILLVILVLLLVYRSPVAALVPLISIASAYMVARGILGFAAQAGARLPSILEAMIVVLIFGVGTDYALFLISRFREEMAKSQNRSEAMIRSVAKIGPVITASAATVIIGLLGMSVADFGMTRSSGPAEALGIFITLLAALSLTPALLQLFGQHLFWPFHRRLAKQRIGEGFINWKNISRFVTEHPLLVSIVVIVALLIPYPAWMNMKSAFNILNELPADMDSTQGFRVIQDHFSAGEFAPVTVILTSNKDDLLAPNSLHDIAQVTEALRQVEGVDRVRSLVQPTGDPEDSKMLRVDGQLNMFAGNLAEMSQKLENPAQLAQNPTEPSPGEGFKSLRNYLKELGEAFPEIKEDPSYTDALSTVDELDQQFQAILEQARVDTQLSAMADRMAAMGDKLASPAALSNTGAGEDPTAGLETLRTYLQALAQTYPEVKDLNEYREALGTLDVLEQHLTQMKTQVQVSYQLQEMSTRIAQMQQAMATPAAMTPAVGAQGQNPATGLVELSHYLQGLGQAYPEIRKTPAYTDALTQLQAIQEAMQNIQKQASVSNQLVQLIEQMQQLQKILANPQALGQAPSRGQNPSQGLDVIAAYLRELGDAYPQVKQMPQYQDALQRVTRLKDAFTGIQQAQASGAAVPPEQMQATLGTMQEDVNALISELQTMQQGFAQHPEAVLYPKSLPTPPEATRAMQQLQERMKALNKDLNTLSQIFAEEYPQATYVPESMMNRPEVKQAIQDTQTRLQVLVKDLRGLAAHFEGKEAYFFPKEIAAEGQAAQAMSTIHENLNRLREDLVTLRRRFQDKDAYFIPLTFLNQMPELRELTKNFLSADGTATRFTVLLSGDPYSAQASDTIDRLKTTLESAVQTARTDNGHIYKAYLGGVPVMSHDLKRTVDRDFGKVQAVVVAGVFLVLIILLRSLVAPIYLVLTVLLSYGTTIGLTTFIFQDVMGQEGVNYMLPIMVFVLLVALGADYNIFLMSRVQEESEKTGDVRKGVQSASAYTGGIITSCGIILAGTFAALAISPLRMLVQIGVAVALGVLVDTFIVRTLLVPGIATLLGKWNWWPRRS